MGFGSYDESEQERQEPNTDFDSGDAELNERDDDHDGSMEFENGASNDELVARLQEIKDEE